MTRARAEIVSAAIAVAVTALLVAVETAVAPDLRGRFYEALIDPSGVAAPPFWDGIVTALVWTLPESVVALSALLVLRRRFMPEPASADETRCRRCGYILRGLREPRCPECGEAI